MRALISVSDKSQLGDLAHFLQKQEIEMVSSGGTRRTLEDLGFAVTPIEQVTGNPEAFGGRMKTLSFQVSSGILFRRDDDNDINQARELGITPIDIVVCNLYPFAQVKQRNGEWHELIEHIDIGGPTLIRAAAKNYRDVWTLTNPGQYHQFTCDFTLNEEKALAARQGLARMAFGHTAAYDALIAQTFEERDLGSAQHIHIDREQARTVRYGENPHQRGMVWGARSLAAAKPLHGKELSYNNYLDADAAWRCVGDLHHLNESTEGEFSYAVTVIKHSNPCGAAMASSGIEALKQAWHGDQVSAFGSIIACNQQVDESMATFLNDRFVEVVMAPAFSPQALSILTQKKNIRLLELEVNKLEERELMVRTIAGGYLLQEEDPFFLCSLEKVVGDSEQQARESLYHFGTLISKHLKSNAIALVSQNSSGFQLIGAGMGNPNRFVSLQQAVNKAQENGHHDLSSAVLISDAFFPFRDNIDLAHEYGLKTIIQPGGSIKDQEVIEACREHNITMLMTGRRHFRH